MVVYNSFIELYKNKIISLVRAHPDWIRLDGALSGGNREIFGKFKYKNKIWKIHSDSHIEKLSIAYTKFLNGEDPFKETYTSKNKLLKLELKNNIGFKHLYIYLT